MDLDDAQARSSGADARLEKPFDVETLRKQVLELVPRTRSQRLAHFLEFSPKLNEELKSEVATQPSPLPARKAAPPPPPPFTSPLKPDKSTWSMESFEDPSNFETSLEAEPEDESFQPLELSQLSSDSFTTPSRGEAPSGLKLESASENPVGDDESWARQDLSQFKLDLPPISVGDGGHDFKIDMGEDEFSSHDIEINHDESVGNDLTLEPHQINEAEHEIALPLEPLFVEEPFEFATPQTHSTSAKTRPAANQMSAEHLESMIRAQSREMIELVVRKIVPELATKIIREELERLLSETATSSGKETRL